MTTDNFFDFNTVDVRYADVGAEAAHYIADAVEQPTGTRARSIAALAAARQVVLHFAKERLGYETTKALDSIASDLERVEYALRDLEDGLPPTALTAPTPRAGRPPESNAVLDFQARSVAAVSIIRQLPEHSVSRDEAITLVAPFIPRALLQPHPNTGPHYDKLSQKQQLIAWLDAFSRKGSRRYGKLSELSHELNASAGFPRNAAPADVLRWLKTERERLLAE